MAECINLRGVCNKYDIAPFVFGYCWFKEHVEENQVHEFLSTQEHTCAQGGL